MVFSKKRRVQISAFALIILLIAAMVIVREVRKPEPIPNYSISERSGETTVVIPSGSTGDEIAKILFDAGVVKSARAFFAAATANPKSQSIQPGTYTLDTKIPGAEAVMQLLDRERRTLVLLIKEGERTYEIGENLARLKFNATEIEAFINEQVAIPGFGEQDPEGFFFPATYNLTPNDDLSVIRKRLLSKFEATASELDFQAGAEKLGLTPYEALIIASITQSEGFNESDFRKIARVIYNRIDLGMPLQMDSSVLYALKERRIAVTRKDIGIASAYNTYNRRGLPPTPISNPGRAALAATLNPETGDWLYFVTVAPSVTKFTASYEEFLSFKREFQKNLKAGKFGGES